MSRLRLEVASRSFAVEVTVKEFRAIERADDKNLLSNQMLSQQLDRIPGVDDIEYNGHFGPYIYLRIDAEHDNAETHALVCSTIESYIRTKGKAA